MKYVRSGSGQEMSVKSGQSPCTCCTVSVQLWMMSESGLGSKVAGLREVIGRNLTWLGQGNE